MRLRHVPFHFVPFSLYLSTSSLTSHHAHAPFRLLSRERTSLSLIMLMRLSVPLRALDTSPLCLPLPLPIRSTYKYIYIYTRSIYRRASPCLSSVGLPYIPYLTLLYHAFSSFPRNPQFDIESPASPGAHAHVRIYIRILATPPYVQSTSPRVLNAHRRRCQPPSYSTYVPFRLEHIHANTGSLALV